MLCAGRGTVLALQRSPGAVARSASTLLWTALTWPGNGLTIARSHHAGERIALTPPWTCCLRSAETSAVVAKSPRDSARLSDALANRLDGRANPSRTSAKLSRELAKRIGFGAIFV
jgi:hypothetical protein